jgi:predicted lipoprotein
VKHASTRGTSEFLNYFRKKASTFNELLAGVQDHLKKSDTNMKAAVKLEGMLETVDHNNTTLKNSSRRKQ